MAYTARPDEQRGIVRCLNAAQTDSQACQPRAQAQHTSEDIEQQLPSLVTETDDSAAAQQQVVVALKAQLDVAEKLVAKRQQVIAALQSQLSTQTTASQEADMAAQHAQQALLDAHTQLQLEKSKTADAAEELLKAQNALQDQSRTAQQQQAELQQAAARQSELNQQVANLSQQLSENTQTCSQLTQSLEAARKASSEAVAQLQCCHVDTGSLQESIAFLEQQLAVVMAEKAATAEEAATVKQKYAESMSLSDKLSFEMDQLAHGSASSTQLLHAELEQQARQSKQLQQQLHEAQEAADLHRAAAEQLQCVLNAAQEGSAQLKQKIHRLTQEFSSQPDAHSDKVTLLQKQAQALTQQLKAQQQAHAADSAHQLKAQAEAHSAELSQVSAKHARAQSRADQLLTELQAAQQACQALLKQAGDAEADVVHLRAEAQELRSSLHDRDDLILDLDTQIKVGCCCRVTAAVGMHACCK